MHIKDWFDLGFDSNDGIFLEDLVLELQWLGYFDLLRFFQLEKLSFKLDILMESVLI